MLSREQVFGILDKERRYQDSLWPPHDGQKNTQHTLTTLQVYLRKAEDAWIVDKYEVKTWQQLAKIAAVIVRALEVGNETEELVKGLR
jgi:hypothetical protein